MYWWFEELQYCHLQSQAISSLGCLALKVTEQKSLQMLDTIHQLTAYNTARLAFSATPL